MNGSHFYGDPTFINFASQHRVFSSGKMLFNNKLLVRLPMRERPFSPPLTAASSTGVGSCGPCCISLVFILLITLFPGSESFAQDTVFLTLEKAIRQALDNNPEIRIAAKQTLASQIAVREAKGNFFPKLTLNGTYTRNIDKPVIFFPEALGGVRPIQIGSNNNFVTYLDLSVPLYSKLNLSARQVAHSSLGLQREVLNGQQQAVVADVRKGYSTYQVSLAAVSVREKGLENAIENLVNTEEKAAQGAATEYDVTSAEVKVASARNNLLESRSQVIPAANKLRLLMGLDMQTPLVLQDSLSLDKEELMITANPDDLSNNSDLRQRELNLEIARQKTLQVKSSYYPILSGVGTYQYQSQDNNFNFSEYDWVQTSALGMRLQVPLFNGTVTRHKVQQSVMNEEIAEVQKENTEQQNQARYQQLLSELNYIRQRIAAQSENIRLAEKALSLVKERYHYGKASMLEVNSAELDYITARLNYLQTISDYKSAYCDYQLLTGQIH
ncbi:MAG TPA: TolC family protein [Chryseosolibacter sp.]|nr:TolC family protein [Chryseosolibacter sp.]